LNLENKEGEGTFVLPVELKVYSLEAIKKAVYKFADKASVLVKTESDSVVRVVFTFSEGIKTAQAKEVLSEFQNELLDQDLRLTIAQETKAVRNLILAHAFSRSSLVPQSDK